MKKDLWLSDKIIFDWEPFLQGGTVLDTPKITRAYEIWERANSLISNSVNDFDLSDTILNLKRSLDQRLKLIEKIYSFKKKDIENKPKHYLELLSHLGIIRPLLLNKLLEIRNAIEHEDKKPPKRLQCLELVDIVWYFLKSTDTLVSIEKSGFEVDGIQEKYGYNLEVDWKKDKIEISGWFPIEFISEKPEKDFFKVNIKKRETKAIWGKGDSKLNYHKNKSINDTWLIGNLILSPKELLKFYRKIFSIYN